MSSKPKTSQLGRRVKPATQTSDTKANQESKNKPPGNKGYTTTTKIISAPPVEVDVTPSTPPTGFEPTTSTSKNYNHQEHTLGTSPSDVAVRYSLTPASSGENPELEGVQVNIEPDPLGVDSRLAQETESSNARALVPTTGSDGDHRNHLAPNMALHEGYSSSEDSTMSPRSAGDEARQMSIVRTGAQTDSSEGSSSIAVDCHTGPSEVIVKGKNVRKIHVKFPPHPPQSNGDEDVQKSLNSFNKPPKSGRFRRQASMHRTTGSQPQEHGDDHTGSSQEFVESSSSLRTNRALPLNTAPVLPGIRAPSYIAEQPSPGIRDSGVSTLNLDMQLSTSYEWDQKIKHDIMNGLEYFERKNSEIKQINNRIVTELDRVTRLNHELEGRLKMSAERNNEIKVDNDELKIRMDQKEKENDKLKEQAMTQWQARVKADELFMELKRDTDNEMSKLKELLTNKEKEVARLVSSVSQRDKSMKGSLRDPGIASKSLRSNMEDHLELLHKISRLEEEISKLRGDNEKEKVASKKAKDDTDTLSKKLKDHSVELDSQYKRFLSLKKNFNDVRDENEKLKLQLRGRRNFNPNNTWPKNTGEPGKPAENEAVSVFDIPGKYGKSSSPAGKKLAKPLFLEHKRTPSDGRPAHTENLPPVAAPMK